MEPSTQLFILDKVPVISIGKAVSILASADEKEFLSGLMDTEGTTAIGQALYALQFYIIRKTESTLETCIPLLEQVIKKGTARKKALRVFHWLIGCDTTQDIIIDWISKHVSPKGELSNEEKKRKLAAILVIRDAVEPLIGNLRISSHLRIHVRRIQKLEPLLSSLLASVRNDSAVVRGTQRSPTRLSLAAADAFALLSCARSMLAACPPQAIEPNQPLVREVASSDSDGGFRPEEEKNEDDDGDGEWLQHVMDYVETIVEWYSEGRPVAAAGLRLWMAAVARPALRHAPRSRAVRAYVAASWQAIAPWLVEDRHDTAAAVEEVLTRLLAIDAVLSGDAEADDSETADESVLCENARHCAVLLAVLIGRAPLAGVGRASRERLQKAAMALLHPRYSDGAGHVAAVAVGLLRGMLSDIAHSTAEAAETAALKLLAMLDECDEEGAASTGGAVPLMLGEAICRCRRPEPLVAGVFQRLAASSSSMRRMALSTVEVVATFLLDESPTDAARTRITDSLAVHLLSRLHDEELGIRARAARLFSRVDPAVVVPRLVPLVGDRDARVRSSAEQALQAVLKDHPDTAAAVSAMLDSLRDCAVAGSHTPPESPADIGRLQQQHQPPSPEPARRDLVDRVLRIVPAWAERLSQNRTVWPAVVLATVRKLFGAPSDTVLVQFLSKLGPHLGSCAAEVLSAAIERLEGQPPATAEAVEAAQSTSEPANDAEQELRAQAAGQLFGRVAPLIVMKLVPLQALAEGGERLVMLLPRLMESPVEFDQVRKLAAEQLARLPPAVAAPQVAAGIDRWMPKLPSATSALTRLSLDVAKAYTYSACNGLMLHGRTWAVLFHRCYGRWLEWAACAWLAAAANVAPWLHKLQLGWIDLIALWIRISVSPSSSTDTPEPQESPAPWTQTLSWIPPVPSLARWVPVVLDMLTGSVAGVPLPVRICLANSIISTAKQPMFPTTSLLELASMVVPRLCNVYWKAGPPQATEERTAYLQVLFSLSFHLREAVTQYATELLSVGMSAIQDRSSAAVRSAGLKLLGTLMANSSESVVADPALLVELQRRLQSLSNIDSDPEVRKLAETLSHHAFS